MKNHHTAFLNAKIIYVEVDTMVHFQTSLASLAEAVSLRRSQEVPFPILGLYRFGLSEAETNIGWWFDPACNTFP